jgi:hypothetical protein
MKTFTILNSEGDILKLEIENNPGYLNTLTLCANTHIGIGQIYLPVSASGLRDYFNSKITLHQIIQNTKEDRFLLIKYDKGYIVDRAFVAHGLQCGDMLYRDILDDMKIDSKEIKKIIRRIQKL